ncbi:MAG: light-independent protochlorophyllide reductase subunit B [Methanoregulaceae archaeon PtaB.Bin056]|nr:MAG: light-independent protochlorophyllide reductase subunit B [Methanoregulaceae archaeon PtaB.Bin056]
MATPNDDGCTLTGALSVTTEILRSITIIHGPAGCAHHNFSLLHALHASRDFAVPPPVISTDMTEKEVIFGGEHILEEAVFCAAEKRPDLICVLSTCVSAAIGDDVEAVCRIPSQVPVVHVPTAGFLGGGFLAGHIQALISLSRFARRREQVPSVNLIGEKTLEYEVDEHYREVLRLLTLLGVPVNVRFVCGVTLDEISHLGEASLNILRDPSMQPVGEHLRRELGIPYIDSFPLGLEGTLRFLDLAGRHLSIDPSAAVAAEEALQKEMIGAFTHLRRKRISFPAAPTDEYRSRFGYELADMLELEVREGGNPVPLPDPFPVGTSGIRRLLHRWRRRCHA